MRLTSVICVTALALSACAVHVNRAVSPETTAATIRARLDSTAMGWNRGELAGYMAMYDPGAGQMGANGAEWGRDTILAGMRKGFWRTGRPLQQLRYENVDVRMLGAHHALVTGKFVLTGADRPQRTGVFSTVWTDESGEWKMLWDHSG
jgi:hypothetical protein